MGVPVLFAAVTFDWGTVTLKDVVYGIVGFGALWLGKQKVWAWFYQLEDCRTLYQQQLDDARADFKLQMETARADFKFQIETLRTDFRLQLEAAESRGASWRELVIDGRALVQHSVNATVELAKRHVA